MKTINSVLYSARVLADSPVYRLVAFAYSLFALGLLVGLIWFVPFLWGQFLYLGVIALQTYMAVRSFRDLIEYGDLTLS